MTDTRPAHPLERARALGTELRTTFALTAPEIQWLLARWRDVADVPIPDDALGLVARLVVIDTATAPLTVAEARGIATSAVQDFATLEDARGAVQRYAALRGADAVQCAKLDTLVREKWHAQQRTEVARAA
jgi:hypothetical protein